MDRMMYLEHACHAKVEDRHPSGTTELYVKEFP